MAKKEKKPTHEIRFGAIRASIWENESSKGEPWYSVTTGRLYKDDEEQWQTSQSMRMRDLPLLVSAAQSAYAWIHENAELRHAKTVVESESENRLYKRAPKSKRRSA